MESINDRKYFSQLSISNFGIHLIYSAKTFTTKQWNLAWENLHRFITKGACKKNFRQYSNVSEPRNIHSRSNITINSFFDILKNKVIFTLPYFEIYCPKLEVIRCSFKFGSNSNHNLKVDQKWSDIWSISLFSFQRFSFFLSLADQFRYQETVTRFWLKNWETLIYV